MKDLKWFTGVVEDVNDPQERGRVKVRCIGYHTPDTGELPTSSLPWATPLMPVTSASMSGIGQAATGLLPGSWVMGVFRDGDDHQDPVVIGSIPGNSTRGSASGAFADPSGVYPKRSGVDSPTASTSNYKNSSGYSVQSQTDHETVEMSVEPALKSIDSTAKDAKRGSWSAPSTADTVKPSYPHNSATRTVSGHLIEIDDTPGAERISETHKSGTMRQIDASGNLTTTIVSSSYKIVLKDDNVLISGSCNVTIKGDCRTLIRGNHVLEVEGNMYENIKGSKFVKIGGDEKVEIAGEVTANIGGDRKVLIGAEEKLTIGANSKTDIGGNNSLSTVGDYTINTLGERTDFTAGTMNSGSGGEMVIGSAGDTMINAAGDTTIKGANIQLNP